MYGENGEVEYGGDMKELMFQQELLKIITSIIFQALAQHFGRNITF